MMEKASQPILIVGGTGVQGGNVARELLNQELIRNGGFRHWTILHPCKFMESFEEVSAREMEPELKDGVLFGILKPDTQVKWTCGDNTAQFARAAIESPEKFNRKDINVAGDELPITCRHKAKTL